MQYLKQVAEFTPEGTVASIQVQAVRQVGDTVETCSEDHPDAVAFAVYARSPLAQLVVEFPIVPLAREWWLARALALAAAAQLSMRFNVPIEVMQ